MNISNTLAASFSLGLLTCLSGTALAMMGDAPRVQVVELPNEDMLVTLELAFSDDGSTVIARQNEFVDQRVLVHRDGVWELVLDYSGQEWTGTPQITGVSADGSVFAITDNNGSLISRDGVISEIPDVWIDDAGQIITDGQVYVRSVSRDGQTLGLAGSADGVFGTDALIWNNAKGLLNLNIGFTGDEASHQIMEMSPSGFAIAGSSAYVAQSNNYRQYYGFHDAWVLAGGGLIMIPQPNVGEDVLMKAVDVSGDGQAVIGLSVAPWRYNAPLQQAGVITAILQPTRSWIWSPEFGTQLIEAPARYSHVLAFDISGNGEVVLGYGYGRDVSEQFLWTRADGFVPLWDYLDSRGIENELYFSAQSISDDGSLLMGWGYDDELGTYSAVIVDIGE